MTFRFALLAVSIAAIGCTPSSDVDLATHHQTNSQPAAVWDFRNIKLTLQVVEDPWLAEATAQLRGEWQAATGGTFEVLPLPMEDLDLDNLSQADAVLYPVENLAELAEQNLLLPLSATALKDADLDWPDVFNLLRSRQAKWGEKTVAITFGSPQLVLLYRADLFERFKRKPPATWGEYVELAQFFADRRNLDDAAPASDQPWSGTLEPLGDYWASHMLLTHAAAYAQHPSHYSALFNMETMEPLIAGPPFVRALEELVKANQTGDDRKFKSTPQEVCKAFLQGESAMALTWPMSSRTEEDAAKQNRADQVTVSARWGIAPLPGSREVYSPGKKQWEDRRDGAMVRVPLLGATGRLGSVLAKTSHAEAATHLLAWLNGPRWSARICSTSDATAPFRASHRQAAAMWLPPELSGIASDYADILRSQLNGDQAMMALNLPRRDCYLFALDDAVRKTLQGKESAAESLQLRAETWREVNERFGSKSQRQAYQHSLGLEP